VVQASRLPVSDEGGNPAPQPLVLRSSMAVSGAQVFSLRSPGSTEPASGRAAGGAGGGGLVALLKPPALAHLVVEVEILDVLLERRHGVRLLRRGGGVRGRGRGLLLRLRPAEVGGAAVEGVLGGALAGDRGGLAPDPLGQEHPAQVGLAREEP